VPLPDDGHPSALIRSWGQLRNDVFPGCREINVEQHVVLYQPEAIEITVVRVLHKHQDPTGKVAKPRS
jgi:plasmid stabilization system protein ParE